MSSLRELEVAGAPQPSFWENHAAGGPQQAAASSFNQAWNNKAKTLITSLLNNNVQMTTLFAHSITRLKKFWKLKL